LRSVFATPSSCFAFVILLCIASWPAAGNEQRRRIYFLESLSPTQPAAIRTIGAFAKRLSEKTSQSFEIFIDYMELARFRSQAHIDRTVQYLAGKYAEAPPDVLIPLGRAAVPFMLQYRDLVAPLAPLIMASVPTRTATEAKGLRNAVWVVSEYNFAKTLELAERLQPKARDVVVVAGASEYDRSWVDDARRELAPLQRYKARYIVGLPYDDMLREVSQLPRDTIVMMSFVFTDGAGLPRVPPDVAAAVADHSAAPVYSPVSTFFGRGIVGGYMDSFEAHGVAAADLALDILSGKSPAALPAQTKAVHRYEVDARQLERWGLSARRLPPDALVSFREPSVWEQHRGLVIAACLVFALQSALVGVLLIQRQRRQRAEAARKAAEAEAALQRQEVAHLMRVSTLGELSGAIAHEINQPLTAILSNAQAALELLAGKSPDLAEVRDVLQDIVHEDNRAGEVIQRLRNLLRKGERKFEPVDVNDLVNSTIALLHSELIGRNIEVRLDLADTLPATSGDPVQLQQVLLNLIMNAMDAMASTPLLQRIVTVSTRATQSGLVVVRVKDRGAGIPPEQQVKLFKPFHTTKPHGLGLGLSICSTIVQAHGGKLMLENDDAGGTIAAFSLPAEDMLMAAQ
jgi:signal transduction histidine kinase